MINIKEFLKIKQKEKFDEEYDQYCNSIGYEDKNLSDQIYWK